MPGMYHLKKIRFASIMAKESQLLHSFKNLPIPASFCLFLSFSHYNFDYTNERNVDGVLRILTRGSRMVSADETTELMWLH